MEKAYHGAKEADWGLTSAEVEKSRAAHGENILTPPKRTSLWALYLEKYRDPIIQILLVAAAVSLALAFVEGEFVETIGIFLAIFIATTVGFYFERDAARKFQALNQMGEEHPVKVKRDGQVTLVPRREVVVGDVVLIETGDEVPADGTLTHAVDLQIDESSLTGEPISSKRARENGTPEDADRAAGDGAYPKYVALRSTMVMAGRGVMHVTAVGDKTEIGHVAAKSSEQTNVKTPLSLQLNRLAKLISKVGTAVAIMAFVVFLGHDILVNKAVWGGDDYIKMAEVTLQYFMMAVTLIVMAVPEGLPMAVTLALALNMRRMLKSNNLVRKLHACETMGAVTVICTDKTGTLTQNRMTVGEMVIHGNRDLLIRGLAVNTTAELDGAKGVGNPTEVALLLWMAAENVDYHPLRQQAKLLEQVPFSTEKKYMSTTIELDGRPVTFVKGAPEVVMAMCDMDESLRHETETQLAGFQKRAMRTLAFAANGEFQGFAAIADPVRADVPDAVKQCRQAGIEVKIVTGDTAATAAEIGRQIGCLPKDAPEEAVMTGPEWASLTDQEAYQRARALRVMARARPADKQRLVEMLQKRGEVVAVTGDGTNDAPALNHAHVGLSLGSGTAVAMEASDMTLLDDSFKSIANAVMWGRSLYKNIQRFLFFQLVVNLTALLLVLGGSIIGTEMPLTVTQILWVNLIMDTFAAMALASLPPSREVMTERPRGRNDFILPRSMMFGIAFCGLSFFLFMFVFLIHCEFSNGMNGVDKHELTLFFTTFVLLQWWNLFNAKALLSSHSAFHHFLWDRGMLFVLALILVGQILITQFGGTMFRTDGMSLSEWLTVIGGTSVVLWAVELWRLWKRKRG